MIAISNGSYINRFEYAYLFVMCLYAAMLTSDTSLMFSGFAPANIFFWIPIILTSILVSRNCVVFHSRNLFYLILSCLLWTFLVMTAQSLFNISEISWFFSLFYSIIIAYIHVQVYGEQLLPTYETIIVQLCKISLFFWFLGYIFPSLYILIGNLLPETHRGNHLFYLFQFEDITRQFRSMGYLRNCGFTWEAGRFASMICLAVMSNIFRNGIKFSDNKNILILLFTLLTTFSTTGIVAVFILYFLQLQKENTQYKSLFLILIIPIAFSVFSLDFVGKKIQMQLDEVNQVDARIEMLDWNRKNNDKGEYLGSLSRFEGLFFECKNIFENPLLGYGRNPAHSFFYKKISSNFVLTGGLLKIIGQHGLFLGIFFYYLLYKSSIRLSQIYPYAHKYSLFILISLLSISYIWFCVPIFMALWFFDYFNYKQETGKL